MSKAIYHPEAGREVELEIASRNPDGTANLSFEGTLVVTSCKVTDEPAIGSCVIPTKETKEKETKEK
jgi:hypothetical protein